VPLLIKIFAEMPCQGRLAGRLVQWLLSVLPHFVIKKTLNDVDRERGIVILALENRENYKFTHFLKLKKVKAIPLGADIF
jgi:hypothetical protein